MLCWGTSAAVGYKQCGRQYYKKCQFQSKARPKRSGDVERQPRKHHIGSQAVELLVQKSLLPIFSWISIVQFGYNWNLWVLSHFLVFEFCNNLSLFSYTILVYDFCQKVRELVCQILSFWVLKCWVLSHFDFFSFAPFWVFEFCHILRFGISSRFVFLSFVTFSVFEFCHIFRFWGYHIFSFFLSH